MNACVWMTSDFLYPLTRGSNVKSLSVSYVSDCEVLSICLQSLAAVDVSGIQGFEVFYDGDYCWAIASLSWELCHVNSQLLPSRFSWPSLYRTCQGEPEHAWSVFEEMDNVQCPTSLWIVSETTATYPFLWLNCTNWTGLTSVLGSLVTVVRCSVELFCMWPWDRE